MTNDRIAAFALEIGASGIACDARAPEPTSARELCRRLEHHLVEHQRALTRSPEEMMSWTNGLMLARILAERVLDKWREEPDVIGDELVRWLDRERRKFVMSTKADALAVLRARCEALPIGGLPRSGPAAVSEIADDLVRPFHASLVRQVRTATAALASRLVHGLHELFHALPVVLPADAFAGLGLAPRRTYRLVRGPIAGPGALGQLADRLTGRRRICGRLEAQLADELERVSALWTREAKRDYAEASDAIERRFCALLDAAVETGKSAASFADRARRDGVDGLVQARHRLDQWSSSLDELVSHLS